MRVLQFQTAWRGRLFGYCLRSLTEAQMVTAQVKNIRLSNARIGYIAITPFPEVAH
jgi:hypothetical protein